MLAAKRKNEGWGSLRAWGTACMGIHDGETYGHEDEWRHVVGSCVMKENGSSGGVVDGDNGD